MGGTHVDVSVVVPEGLSLGIDEVRGIVDHPDDVVVRDKQMRRGSILEVRVHPDDLGKVIGRNGRTATAFRTVVSALAGRGGARVVSITSFPDKGIPCR